MKSSAELPVPNPAALERSTLLVQRIGQSIAQRGGWIPFSEFMAQALYTPGLGYYSASAEQIGPGGDFTTAPQTSALFGTALAHQVAQIMQLSSPSVLEFGPGRGLLACDILGELERLSCLPQRYALVELSGALRAQQRATLEARVPHLVERCVWLDTLPDSIEGAVVANEVLDAMPIEWLRYQEGAWRERGVALDGHGGLVLSERSAAETVRQGIESTIPDTAELVDGYLTELGLQAQAFTRTLAARLRAGAAVLIDYGFPAGEFYHPQRGRGTLIAHYRHRAHEDVLRWPGLQDITAHVDFTSIAEQAHEGGCDLLGYTSQAHFLLNCGITERLSGSPDDSARWLPAVNGLQRLLSESEMGELFKVIAFGRGITQPLLGFARADRLSRL